MEAVDGALLAEPFTWTFSTIDPAVIEVQPRNLSTGVRLEPERRESLISITFNQPMDRESTEASFYLRPDGQESGSVTGEFSWSQDSTSMTFTTAMSHLPGL